MPQSNFISNRISRTSKITINAPLSEAFPLFGPIKEMEWAKGWNPQIIYSTTNLVEEHMIFQTPAHHGHEDSIYTWIISKYEPENTFIEYTVFTSERVWWIAIQCTEASHKSTTAEITYTYTGLTTQGIALNELALPQIYARDLQDWQEAINQYLAQDHT